MGTSHLSLWHASKTWWSHLTPRVWGAYPAVHIYLPTPKRSHVCFRWFHFLSTRIKNQVVYCIGSKAKVISDLLATPAMCVSCVSRISLINAQPECLTVQAAHLCFHTQAINEDFAIRLTANSQLFLQIELVSLQIQDHKIGIIMHTLMTWMHLLRFERCKLHDTSGG